MQTIDVGTEPRGCALTPNGTLLYVANHTEGTVAIIATASRTVVGKVDVGRNPTAIAITNNGDESDADETVFVTQIFAELDPAFVDPFGVGGEMRDLGKRGVVQAFPAGSAGPLITKITLSPIAESGFSASRASFCPGAHPAHQANPVFCPDPTLPATDPVNTNNQQGMFPNQLLSALIRGNRLYLPNIAAAPEPPEKFDVNVQALVSAVDTAALTEVVDEAVNLNQQIDVETAAPPPSLDRTFANDIVAIDANLAGDTFAIVSRGGNQVFRAKLDPDGKLNLLNAAASRVDCRIQTGNLPSGIAMRQDGTRAYANNEANFSVTSMNIENGFCLTLRRDIDSSEPPAPGSFEHAVLVGKLAFFTAFGIPDNDIFGTPIRNFVPRNFKGKMSKDGWSTCGSCHPDGLADGVTWSFGTGPRQTIPLDGMFSKQSPDDQRLLNWSAVRGSNTDFNANSRVTQGGCGFASDAVAPGQCFALGNTTPANPADLRPRHHARGQRRPRCADVVDLRRGSAAAPAAERSGRAGGWTGRLHDLLRILPRWGQVVEERDLPSRQSSGCRPEWSSNGSRCDQAAGDASISRECSRTNSNRSRATTSRSTISRTSARSMSTIRSRSATTRTAARRSA